MKAGTKKEEYRVMYKSGDTCTQVDNICLQKV